MVEEEILPLVINYLEDLTNTVRKTAQTSLVGILEFFSPDVCHKKILPNIIGLAEKQNDDYRTEAVTLLAKLSPILGIFFYKFKLWISKFKKKKHDEN